MWFLNVFSQSVICLCIFFLNSVTCRIKVFNFDELHLFFSFMNHGVLYKNFLPNLRSQRVSMFSSRSFRVLHPIRDSELTFTWGVLFFSFCVWICSVSVTVEKAIHFPLTCFCSLSKVNSCICVGLFLNSLFCLLVCVPFWAYCTLLL